MNSSQLDHISDEIIIEEAAKRLQQQYQKDHRTRLLYGTFRFVFHDGRFQGVEDWPRNKRYQSPTRFASISKITSVEEVG